MTSTRSNVCAAAFFALTTLGASAALADDPQWVLSPGPFGEVSFRCASTVDDDTCWGGGVEVSVMRYPGPVRGNPVGYGAALRLGVFEQQGNAAWYASLSAQAGTFIGGELGVFARSAAGDVGAEFGLRLAPYLSYGIAWVAVPFEVPLVRGEGSLETDVRIGLTFGIKIPFALTGGRLLPRGSDFEPTPTVATSRPPQP